MHISQSYKTAKIIEVTLFFIVNYSSKVLTSWHSLITLVITALFYLLCYWNICRNYKRLAMSVRKGNALDSSYTAVN